MDGTIYTDHVGRTSPEELVLRPTPETLYSVRRQVLAERADTVPDLLKSLEKTPSAEQLTVAWVVAVIQRLWQEAAQFVRSCENPSVTVKHVYAALTDKFGASTTKPLKSHIRSAAKAGLSGEHCPTPDELVPAVTALLWDQKTRPSRLALEKLQRVDAKNWPAGTPPTTMIDSIKVASAMSVALSVTCQAALFASALLEEQAGGVLSHTTLCGHLPHYGVGLCRKCWRAQEKCKESVRETARKRQRAFDIDDAVMAALTDLRTATWKEVCAWVEQESSTRLDRAVQQGSSLPGWQVSVRESLLRHKHLQPATLGGEIKFTPELASKGAEPRAESLDD